MSKELAKTENQQLATLDVASFAEEAGAGFGNADRESFALPFLSVLQGLSPQLENVEGAKPGMLINTITNELFKEANVIPCYFSRRYLRWGARENGGGLKGEYAPYDVDSGKIQGVQRDSFGRLTIDGDQLVDTRDHYVLIQSADGSWQQALLSLSKTQIKKSKKWLTRMQSLECKLPDGRIVTPPSFATMYKIFTIKEENSLGSWWGVDFELIGYVTNEQYQKGKAFFQACSGGNIQAAREQDFAQTSTPQNAW